MAESLDAGEKEKYLCKLRALLDLVQVRLTQVVVAWLLLTDLAFVEEFENAFAAAA